MVLLIMMWLLLLPFLLLFPLLMLLLLLIFLFVSFTTAIDNVVGDVAIAVVVSLLLLWSK